MILIPDGQDIWEARAAGYSEEYIKRWIAARYAQAYGIPYEDVASPILNRLKG